MATTGRRRVTGLVSAAVIGLTAVAAEAVYETDRYEVQAEATVQSTFHSDGTGDWEYVQQRQELLLGLVYRVVPTQSSGFLRKVDFSLLWRGRYDAIFDIRDRYRRRGFDERDDFRFPEGHHPRELYFDVEFNEALRPLSLRIGRQQVVWGGGRFLPLARRDQSVAHRPDGAGRGRSRQLPGTAVDREGALARG